MASKHQLEGQQLRLYTIHSSPPPGNVHSAIKSVVTTPPFAKFDETIALQLHVTLDPRKPNQNLRGSLNLPHGSGKTTNCLILTNNETQLNAAVEAGGIAPPESFEDTVKNLKTGDLSVLLNIDRVFTTPQDMRNFGPIGKVLGPRGLMPNPKSGTVSDDLAKAVSTAKKGSVLIKVDKDGGINIPVGKVSMGSDSISGNIKSVLEQINNLKPTEGKGVKTGNDFWVSACVSRTGLGRLGQQTS